MLNSLRVNQDLTFQEFFNGTLYVCFSLKPLKRFFLFLLALSIISLLLGFVTTSNRLTIASLITEVMPILSLLVLVILLVFLFSFFTYRNKPGIFRNVTYDFTNWGVIRNAHQSQFSKPWRDMFKMKESNRFFILYFSNTDYHLIQKKMFKDKSEVDRFRTLLKENTSH